MVLAVLSELSKTRAFRFYVVLAYLPAEKEKTIMGVLLALTPIFNAIQLGVGSLEKQV